MENGELSGTHLPENQLGGGTLWKLSVIKETDDPDQATKHIKYPDYIRPSVWQILTACSARSRAKEYQRNCQRGEFRTAQVGIYVITVVLTLMQMYLQNLPLHAQEQ